MDEELQQLVTLALEVGATIQKGVPWYGFRSAVTVTLPEGGTFGDVLTVPSPELGRRLGLQLERVLRQALGGKSRRSWRSRKIASPARLNYTTPIASSDNRRLFANTCNSLEETLTCID